MTDAPADPHVAVTTQAGGISSGGLTTADGKPLKAALAQAESRAKRRAFFLVLPLFLFVIITFIVPIGQMLHRSVHNDGFTLHTDIGSKVETPIMVNLRDWFDANPRGTEPMKPPSRHWQKTLWSCAR